VMWRSLCNTPSHRIASRDFLKTCIYVFKACASPKLADTCCCGMGAGSSGGARPDHRLHLTTLSVGDGSSACQPAELRGRSISSRPPPQLAQCRQQQPQHSQRSPQLLLWPPSTAHVAPATTPMQPAHTPSLQLHPWLQPCLHVAHAVGP